MKHFIFIALMTLGFSHAVQANQITLKEVVLAYDSVEAEYGNMPFYYYVGQVLPLEIDSSCSILVSGKNVFCQQKTAAQPVLVGTLGQNIGLDEDVIMAKVDWNPAKVKMSVFPKANGTISQRLVLIK